MFVTELARLAVRALSASSQDRHGGTRAAFARFLSRTESYERPLLCAGGILDSQGSLISSSDMEGVSASADGLSKATSAGGSRSISKAIAAQISCITIGSHSPPRVPFTLYVEVSRLNTNQVRVAGVDAASARHRARTLLRLPFPFSLALSSALSVQILVLHLLEVPLPAAALALCA